MNLFSLSDHLIHNEFRIYEYFIEIADENKQKRHF